MNTPVIDVWIAMNEDGEYEVAKDEDEVVELWDDNVGGLARRIVRLRVTMSAPAVADVEAYVPDEAGQTASTEVGRRRV
jgi:hypothetical protein